jgi:hypothetical protein
MTREEAIAEAERRQASDPDASCWIAALAGRIVDGGPHREARRSPNSATSARGQPSDPRELEQTQLRHLGMVASRFLG